MVVKSLAGQQSGMELQPSIISLRVYGNQLSQISPPYFSLYDKLIPIFRA